MGAGVIACADTATNKAKLAIAINLIILNLLRPSEHFSEQSTCFGGARAEGLM